MKTNVQENLATLRQLMANAGVDAVVINKTDPHQSEYISDYWAFLRRLSGFNGSAANVVVTKDKAMLWTDSRYFLQAAAELQGSSFELMKEGLAETPSIPQWLADNLKAGQRVGIDGMTFSQDAANDLAKALSHNGVELVTDFDPIADTWPDRPALPADPVFVYDLKYAGESADSKMSRVLEQVKAHDADAILISALDEVVWTLNIRAHDTIYQTFATSFLFLSDKKKVLFIDSAKVNAEVSEYLKSLGVETMAYEAVASFIEQLPADIRVACESAKTASKLYNKLGARVVEAPSPIATFKGCKNDVEIAGTRAAMERDGVALINAFMEVERRIDNDIELTELDVAHIFHDKRAEQPLFFDISFGTISGYGPNGAIVHYEANEETNTIVRRGSLLLVDSGAQFYDGTTDITRTIAIGEPTAEQRRDFTLVMKGHIALATAVFPVGTCGMQLDALARQFLWKEGLSYLHGTGHGVGHFLSVHEGPQRINYNTNTFPMMPGMITSDEPGLYRTGKHGIRCENLVLCVPAEETEFGKFLKFEVLTLFPFDLRLFDTSIMSDEEIAWVNNYHRTVAARLTPHLNSVQRTWLEKKTAPLTR
jgi:Xaa-Pro aminopeptidase